jgi:hypothetical protein
MKILSIKLYLFIIFYMPQLYAQNILSRPISNPLESSSKVSFSPGNDCTQAIPVCGNYSLTSMPLSYSGQYPPCFSSSVGQDFWITFTITSTGTLAWSGTPNDLTSEYDWALWDITTGCPGNIACCNYNYAGGSTIGFGMQAQSGTVVCGSAGFSGASAEYSPPMSVTSGKIYALQIANYFGDSKGFSISFSNSTCQIGCVTNVSTLTANDLIIIYPNPANEKISIKTKYQIDRAELFDITGKEILAVKDTKEINLKDASLQSGIYFLKITGVNFSVIKKVVVE